MLDGNMSDGKKTSKNEFIFHPVNMLQSMLYYPWNLKILKI